MKRLIATLAAIAALACAALAQDNPYTNTQATVIGGLEQIWSAFGGTAPTNLTIGPYGSCAIKDNKPAAWSAGVAAVYNIYEGENGQSLGTGLAVDYAPAAQDFTMISGQLVFKTKIQPFKPLFGWDWPLYPYTFAGIGTPLTGEDDATGNAAVIAGAGVAFKFVESERVVFGGSAAYANWSNIGEASGDRIYFGLGLKVKTGASAKSRGGSVRYFGL